MRRHASRLRFAEASAGNPLHRRLRRISRRERLAEAKCFVTGYCEATGASDAERGTRLVEVRRDLARHGFYRHTPEELAYGARVAWRNHGRCVGRLLWESLEVVDCRSITEPGAVASRMDQHLRDANCDGRIRSIISVFQPVEGRSLPIWIESEQITQYACHHMPGNTILGDRQNIETTRIAQSMGWKPRGEPGRFDILPWFLRDKDDRRLRFDPDPRAMREIPIRHPSNSGLDALELRWYTVPIVSSMILTIGGIDYPCAPFNGFYVGTEIASRNFADAKRYDLLNEAAHAMRIETGTANPLWKDETLTELNRAVLNSFSAAGVTMLDHHAAAEQYMRFHG